jgi:DNA-binding NarL/FixJ family response regulator
LILSLGAPELAVFRVLVVDDYAVWRSSIITILNQDPEIEIIDEASDGLEAVRLCEELQPDMVLLDVGLPKLNGIDAARQIREVSPDSKILFVTMNCSHELMREAMRIGAAGCLGKTNARRDLLPAVKAALRDEEFLRFKILPRASDELPEE